MLAPTSNNLSEVYAEFWRMHDVTKSVEESINRIVAMSDSGDAVMTGTDRARWYLVETFAGDEAKAMRWLARRRFGAFQPMCQRRTKQGNLVQGFQPIFSGWIFVYTWDIAKNLRRILSLPGVMRVLSHHVSGMPQPIPDEFVTMLQAEGWDYWEHAPHATHYQQQARRHINRQKPKQKKRRPRPSNKIRARNVPQARLTESNNGGKSPSASR